MDAIMESVMQLQRRGLRNQQPKPNDHVDKDGLLVCGDCGERRQMYLMFDAPDAGDPGHKERMKVVRACKCDRERMETEKREKETALNTRRVEELRNASLMDSRFRDAVFSNFRTTDDNRRNLQICQRYVERFPELEAKNQGLLFWGAYGTGKSYAAACIANELLSRGIPVFMTSLVKLIEAIMSREQTEASILERMRKARLVVFDDLGAERNSGYASEQVYSIVDGRYRQRLPTIYTTNLTLNEMKNPAGLDDGRVFDRIFENCYPVEFTGRSWRRKSAAARYDEMKRLLES